MTEELKQKAENFIIDRYKIAECYREDNAETREYMRMDVHSQYEEEYQLYLAGATENAIQWHDLRKDPNDLPEAKPLNWVLAVYDNGTLWCRARREKFTDGTFWVNSFHHTIENVVLWAKIEIPQFKE